MIRFILRSLWRLLILALGVALTFAAAFVLFPYLDERLPLIAALLLVYVAMAYFGVPTLFRTLRLFIRPNHIPLFATTRDGLPSDPVNIAVVAKSRHQFVNAMKKAGWYSADKANFKNSVRELWAIAFDKPYPNAPFSALYLFNRTFDIGFQIPYGKNKSPRHRHHVRFWELVDARQDNGHFRFWVRHFKRFIGRERTIWIGTAVDDNSSFALRRASLQITHSTHPLHYKERDFFIDSLQKQKVVKDISEVRAGDPFEIRSQQIGNSFISDGKLKIIELK